MTDESAPPTDEDRVAELERRLQELEAATNARVLRAELRAHAIRAGMIDLDGLKLVDATSLRLNQNGEIEDGARLMADLRRSKPWLFQAGNSSTAASPPPTSPPAAKRATDMTLAEWQTARAHLLKRR